MNATECPSPDEVWSDDDAALESDEQSNDSDIDSVESMSTYQKAPTIECDFNYRKEIEQILESQSEVNCNNALSLNKEMQERLVQVRDKLQLMLEKLQQRYKNNELRLKKSMQKRESGIGMRGAYLKGGTFYFKGNMFFKDLNCRNCPNNPDYEERRYVKGEMFPMDFELRGRHIWSLVDKAAILQGIKEQAIDYLHDMKNRSRKGSKAHIDKQVAVHSEKLVNLLARVDENFRIDWEQISAYNVRYRHSPKSCEAMWNVYLHPSLKHGPWTPEENERLLEAVKAHNFQDWGAIAAAVGKRSDYQCFVQYQTTVCYKLPQRWSRWTKDDDLRLMELVKENTVNGVINWSIVTAHFPNKPKSSVQSHYASSLNPQISHAPFTPEEDLLLIAAVKEYGAKFSCIPRHLFPHRSLIQLRSRYNNTLQHRHKLTLWSVDDDKKLMAFIAENGTSSWRKCAETLGNHTRTSCRTRYLTIQKFLEKHPDINFEDMPRKPLRQMHSSVTTVNWSEKLAELRENPNADLRPAKKQRSKPQVDAATKPKKITKRQLKAKEVGIRKAQRQQIQKECQVVKQDNSKQLYVQRLRAVGLNLYHYFKYAYNFRLGAELRWQASENLQTLRLVANALEFNKPIANKKSSILSKIHADMQNGCKALLNCSEHEGIMPTGYCLPPNWSTLMGFRALCVQSAQVQQNAQTDEDDANSAAAAAVQQFRKRLHTLFYKTTLLSRLQPTKMNIQLQRTQPKKATVQRNQEKIFRTSNESKFLHNTAVMYEVVEFDETVAQQHVESSQMHVKQEQPMQFSAKALAFSQLQDIDAVAQMKTTKTSRKRTQTALDCVATKRRCLQMKVHNATKEVTQPIKTEIEM